MDRLPLRTADLDYVFREAVHAGAVPMVVTDPRRPDNPAIFVNDAFVALTGYARDAVIGHNLRLLQGPDTDPATVARLRDAIAGACPVNVDILNYRADGTPFWCALFITPVQDAAGQVTHFFASQLDVTDQRAGDEARRVRDAQMQRDIAETLPHLVWTADPDGTVTWRNQRWVDYTGFDLDELKAGRWFDVLDPKIRDEALAAWAASRASGQPLDLIVRLRGRDGVMRPFLCRAAPLRDARGLISGWFGTHTEITALSDNEARFRLITEALPQLVFSAPPDGAVDYYNRRWYEFTGTRPGESDGDRWHDAIHPDDLPRTIDAWATAVSTGGLYEIEYRLRAADGTWRWFLGRGVPLRDPETQRVLRWLGTCTDIDDAVRARHELARSRTDLEMLVRERTEELRATADRLVQEAAERAKTEAALRQAQKMQAVGQLTGGVAHDFNNLLTVILGSLDMLDRRLSAGVPSAADIARMRRAVGAAMQGATRAAALTQRLLAFSRQRALDPQTVATNTLIAGMLDLLRRTLGEAVAIETDLAPDLWLAHADPNQLESALLNLAVNARDAMPGGGCLRIETANRSLDAAGAAALELPAAGDYLAITVRDTGTGMDAATMRQACDPFFTTKDPGQGTGLGLSQVFNFVHQFEGQVRIESQLGEGTAVTLFLPRAASGGGGVAEADPAAYAPPATHMATVLVVEDDIDVRAFATDSLRELGYHVLETAGAAAALDILDQVPDIALLFTDIVLPGGQNGHDLAVEARRRRPGLKVLLTTGYGGETVRAAGLPDTQVLPKPFTYAELAATLRGLLG
ncbi:hybrid sensor histidine kinase/response regulator [Acidisphaera rubrifaciens]|uniref:histidine kinase n=1 Tax=Acidisphaera rubrifaciens HS-AP3 TaxID=1231350 RepID=A0A0D6P998_9PROT|nr:hybrid sensor histidine kinase/response regulator [Acidisphaera rubrifaciens]GAN77773.1 PAS/PAC sensor hybrid histidine kinase [Acidisphaera rubrifaciens HS-AP3]